MKMTPKQAQAYQAARWQRAMAVRLAQVMGQPAGRSSMVKPVKPVDSVKPKRKP